jgi:hypothetical protein
MASYPSSYPAPVAYNPPSGYSYSQPHQPAVVVPQVMWGSYSQAAPYYPTSASSNHSQSAPARFQMALERTKNNKNIVVVLCDTATGECWNCQVGASKWNKMGAPSQEAEPEMNYGLDWPLPSLPSIKEE